MSRRSWRPIGGRVLVYALPWILLAASRVAAGPGKDTRGTIGAERFVLTDREGRARAELALRADGTPTLSLFDEKLRLRAALRLERDGSPRIVLLNESGRPRIDIGEWLLGQAGVSVADKDGDGGAMLVVDDDGTARMGLFDKRGDRQMGLSLPRIGEGSR